MTNPGIKMTNNVRLSVDWPSFITSIATVAAQGFATAFGVTDGGSNALSSLVSAAGAIKTDTDLGERAWRLFCLTFAWSFDELRVKGTLSGDDLISAVREIIVNAKSEVTEKHQVMPSTFLERPTTLPLYQSMRDKFIQNKKSLRGHDVDSDDDLKARFDTAYNKSVFEVWTRKPEVFEPLAAALRSPGASVSSFELQWEAYRMSLVHEFDVKPIFGQEQTKISLSDVYVPLRALWREDADDQGSIAFDSSGNGNYIVHAVRLDDELNAWVTNGDRDDVLKLIGGSPGSGKSTTVKAFARRVAEKNYMRPLFIPLQHINIERELRDSINIYFTERTGSPFRQPPLSREAVEDGPPMVLIFDGLDELARPGEAANAVTGLFIVKLNQLIASLRGDGARPLRVLVTGRMPSFQAACTYVSATNKKSMEVAGFLPLSRRLSDKTIVKYHGDKALIDLDQRPSWWRQYAPRVGASDVVPPALKDKRLAGLTHEPLLCYLLALSGYAVNNWEDAAENRNHIYEKLVH